MLRGADLNRSFKNSFHPSNKMKPFISNVFFIILFGIGSCLVAVDLRTEYQQKDAIIDTHTPLFSWKVTGITERGLSLFAFQIQVFSEANQIIWDKFEFSNNSKMLSCLYSGPAFQTDFDYFWKVRIWTDNKTVSRWSGLANFSTGSCFFFCYPISFSWTSSFVFFSFLLFFIAASPLSFITL